jgi:hypothetical protein
MVERPMALSFIQPIILSHSLLQRMASNDDGKRKLEEEVKSLIARKRLRPSDDDGSNNDSSNPSDSQKETEEEPEAEEVSSEEMSMNQLNTSEEKLFAKHSHGMLFGDDGDSLSTSSEPRTLESRQRSEE